MKEATHAEVEDRMTNVEEEQSDCSEEVVKEGDEAEVMEDLLLVDCVNLERSSRSEL